MSKTIDNFLQYIKIDTRSEDNTGTSPSTQKQHNLAKLLTGQLEAMGAAEITYDREHCYVYASIPASRGCENVPVLGLVAHMDTAPVVSGRDVKPRIVENYDGGEIILNEEKHNPQGGRLSGTGRLQGTGFDCNRRHHTVRGRRQGRCCGDYGRL